jgi:c-di-GMP-related signal transduction protein
MKDGFTLFQGYFCHHPEGMRAPHIPAKPKPAVARPAKNLNQSFAFANQP